jgi:superfamily II DNA/RNA helicase
MEDYRTRRPMIDLNSTLTVILDEADKMLDMGFEKEIRAILSYLPHKK